MPITIFDSGTIPRDRRAELEAAVVAAGRHLAKLFEGWIVATPDRRKFAVRITSYPELDISVPFDWNATAAEVTERVRAAMDDSMSVGCETLKRSRAHASGTFGGL